MPTIAPASAPTMIHWNWKPRPTRVATMAISMPRELVALPRRAVVALESCLMPNTNRIAEMMYRIGVTKFTPRLPSWPAPAGS